MFGDFEIRELPLSLSSVRKMVEKFLNSQGLRMEQMDRYLGIFDSNEELVGGGGLKDNVVKCIALSESTRNESLSNPLISRIRQTAASDGFSELFLFTKPENKVIFESLAFHTVGEADKAILMETDPRGISSYLQKIQEIANNPRDEEGEKKTGVIVMNCNPLTIGHLYLITEAAARVDHLFIIPVLDSKNGFSYWERKGMLEKATHHLLNVTILPGSSYSVSQATFPTYFIKDLSDASKTQIELDLDIFARHIAPALNATIRFVGSEPTDSLTREYNETMKRLLPQRGIKVVELSRLEQNDKPVSASLVRRLLSERNAFDALHLLPPSSIPYLLAHSASNALLDELTLTPKPGLIDKNDSGAHSDMDFDMMKRSIQVLESVFTAISDLIFSHPELETGKLVDKIREIGLLGERNMLETTKGVNTHRGALFALGIAIAATSRIIATHRTLTAENLQQEIREIGSRFSGGVETNGAKVREKYRIKGAAESAAEGYPQLFANWLPYFRTNSSSPYCLLKLLIRIMTTLDDSNVYHRGGKEGADFVHKTAIQLQNDFSLPAIEKANIEFINRNLSPGGTADMLALTLFISSILPTDTPIIKY